MISCNKNSNYLAGIGKGILHISWIGGKVVDYSKLQMIEKGNNFIQPCFDHTEQNFKIFLSSV
jgi:hypothetical protein